MKKTRHHRVPRMLLKRWTNAKGEVKYRRTHWRIGHCRSRGPRAVMFSHGFYDIPGPGDTQIAERSLMKTEGLVAQVLENLFEHLSPETTGHGLAFAGRWRPAEQLILKDFMLCQLTRGEARRQEILEKHPEEAYVEMWLGRVEGADEPGSAIRKETAKIARDIHRMWVISTQMLPEHREKRLQKLHRCEVVIGQTEPNAPHLALTDEPALMGDRRAQLVLPIDPRYALILTVPHGPQEARKVLPITRATAREWLMQMGSCYHEAVLPWTDEETATFFGEHPREDTRT